MPKADSSTFINKKFHRIIVIEDLGNIGHYRSVLGICDCGKTREFNLQSLKTGLTKSCGCLRTQANKSQRNRATHNLTNHPLYQVWCSMKDRCYCHTDTSYHKYGGRGVIVCEDWRNDFKVFYDWCIANGWKNGLQLDKDKLSNDRYGDIYSPDTCCFLTRKENMQYRCNSIAVVYRGEKKNLSEWCEQLGLNRATVLSRLKRGREPEMAFQKEKLYGKPLKTETKQR